MIMRRGVWNIGGRKVWLYREKTIPPKDCDYWLIRHGSSPSLFRYDCSPARALILNPMGKKTIDEWRSWAAEKTEVIVLNNKAWQDDMVQMP